MEKKIKDIKDSTGRWIKSLTVGGEQFRTVSGIKWKAMRTRCNPNGACQRVNPTYIGCTMSENFKDFQYFTDWLTEQPAYDLEGYDLDKDILVKGNKEYNESVCVLVPHSLNSFLLFSDRSRGHWPLGVYFDTYSQKFAACIKRGQGTAHLGRFDTPEEAHAAYVVAKEAEAKRWAERLRNGEFIVDERVITALENWRVNAEA